MTRLLRALTLLALLPASLPAQSDDAGRLVAALLGDTPMTSDLGDAHRPHRRPAHGIRGEPARLRVGARAIQGGGGRGPEGAVSDAGPLAGALGAGDGAGKGGDFRRAGGGAAVLDGRPRAGPHGSAGGRWPWRRGGLRRARALARRAPSCWSRPRSCATSTGSSANTTRRPAHRATRDRRGRGRPGLHVLAAGEHARPPQRVARLGQPASHDDDGAGRGRPRAAAAAGRHRRSPSRPCSTSAPVPPIQPYNVIGEIRGSTRPDEIVLIGAHLDSWDLGTGALDNGANAVMVIDIARQIAAAGHPARADDPVRAVERRGAEPQRLVRLHAEPRAPSWTST